MDPFTEKEIVDCLKDIALSLREIKLEISDLKKAFKEFSVDEEETFSDRVFDDSESESEDDDDDDNDEVVVL